MKKRLTKKDRMQLSWAGNLVLLALLPICFIDAGSRRGYPAVGGEHLLAVMCVCWLVYNLQYLPAHPIRVLCARLKKHKKMNRLQGNADGSSVRTRTSIL